MPLHKEFDPEERIAEVHKQLHLTRADYESQTSNSRLREIHDSFTIPTPKFNIHPNGIDGKIAADLVRKHLSLDGKPELNLASFVHTGIEPDGLELCKENITKNLADSDEYPALIDLEKRCVTILSNLWHVPEGESGVGTATTGSSEAIMLGGLALKRRWESRQKAAGKSTSNPNIIMGSNAQVALEKFARYFDVEMRLLDVHAKDHFSFDIEDLRTAVDENTIGVFVILGSTYTGHYHDVEAVAQVLDEIHKDTGFDVPIHVDGASGAFVAPFITPDLVWDFRIPRVHSINTSGHKFGLAPVGCGWIVWRGCEYLPEELLFTLSYLGGTETTYTLNFSRPGYPIIYQYFSLLKNGFEGYRNTHAISLENARVLSLFLEESDYFDVLSDIHRPKGQYFSKSGELTYTKKTNLRELDPHSFNPGLPVVAFKLTDDFKKKYPYIPQEAISSLLRGKGYIIPNYPLPPKEEQHEVLRIVINDNVSLDLLDKLLVDIGRVTNRLINVKNILGPNVDESSILKTIALISEADHKEEEHENKWHHHHGPHVNHSRC